MARPVGTGNISFGLVSIPVKLFSTTDHSSHIRFNMLDPNDGSRVKQQYINPNSGEVVKRGDMVKGYEFAKGQYVTFTKEELKELEEKASPAIAITEFLPLEEVEPIYYDRGYFLGPETGGERAYRLLNAAMKKTGRCALAKYAARGKQYLVMIRPYEDGLIMQQMHYGSEVRSFENVPLGEPGELNEAELNLAVQLIEQIANQEFEPDKYQDDVRARIKEAIQGKVDGKEVTFEEEVTPKAQIVDLMEALKKSLSEDAADEGVSASNDDGDEEPAAKAAS